ncbi:PEP-CTERM/exosortase system-associated acyltransferase [Alkalimonas collagenimarina]|uniref:PEP-CTERM/exosortase system-associated acyltransferase n=1 Tax=Alkalimonas collagenimarina TaxID=400390 RepID=A0ABT9GZ64_9GAMM|nr:PEP-CTERM/exosortase system-associated acyltransferase [Alkalimonas collagenimarina]MDP4536347.1 PEP-CTERM/exosortase system-associated acyltransferase [Alkalimonas collagenimarina]
MAQPPINQHFFQYFDVLIANSLELKQEAYAIRYQVYCEELGFEDKTFFIRQLELDDFDLHSVHFLIRHKASGQFAGTVRLILPRDPILHSDQLLPIEHYCKTILHPSTEHLYLSARRCAEVSRLAVRAEFRRRPDEQYKTHVSVIPQEWDPRCFPFISVGLYLSIAAYFVESTELESVMALMEPRLARHLSRVGIYFNQVGSVIDFNGQRAPFVVEKASLIANLKDDIRVLFEHIRQGVQCSLNTQSQQSFR